ncbi:MAG: FHA domain-containing protein, partial [Anaerolineaceae bacterium]
MTGPCSRCGNDPGFDWAICPGCGLRADSDASPITSPNEGATDRWDPTIIEAPLGRERARFGDRTDFYQPVNPPRGGGPLRFEPANDADRTVMDRDYDRASSSAVDDHTIIDRGGARDAEPSDSTIIVRSGRKGITGPLVYLIERNGMRAGRVHLVGIETSIGRGPDQDIVVGDETVSKRHAKVRLEDGQFRFDPIHDVGNCFT